MPSPLEKAIYNRTERLVGEPVLEAMSRARVILFGVGGVGSWCAEGLVRSGVTHLTLVDSDRVSMSNVNRQGMATPATVGQVKVVALKEKLLGINPEAQIEAIQEIYSAETAGQFDLDRFDYVIDAIDSLKNKAALLLHAASSKATLFSAMGAALKIDPTGVRVAEFWDVRGCPLGAALRKKYRKNNTLPARKFLCVYGEEVLPNLGEDRPEIPLSDGQIPDTARDNAAAVPGRQDLADHDWTASKAQVNGTTAHITAIFGFTLSGLVIQDIYRKTNRKR